MRNPRFLLLGCLLFAACTSTKPVAQTSDSTSVSVVHSESLQTSTVDTSKTVTVEKITTETTRPGDTLEGSFTLEQLKAGPVTFDKGGLRHTVSYNVESNTIDFASILSALYLKQTTERTKTESAAKFANTNQQRRDSSGQTAKKIIISPQPENDKNHLFLLLYYLLAFFVGRFWKTIVGWIKYLYGFATAK